MNKFWKSFISPFRKKYIQTADGFMELAKSYSADKKVLGQVRDFVRAYTGSKVKGGFVSMAFLEDDNNAINLYLRRKNLRPTRYFEVLVFFEIVILAENFRIGELEKDLHIIFEKAQEISKRQYKKLIQHFETKSPADKTMRLIKTYPFIYKIKPVVKAKNVNQEC